ncbi:OmpA family protein [Burkholderia contaminans]|uniref:OmpA family protein n=2 Tax=Burkholderia contaminans TaxID=488447 RepID=UPI0009E5FCED
MDNFSAGGSPKRSRQWRSGMRTILRGISCASISLVGLCASSVVFACSFSLQYASKLDLGVVAISNADRIALASLLVTVRNSAANNGPVVIYGYADEHERDAISIARTRANAVRAYLLDLGVANDRIHMDSKIWRSNSVVPSSKRNQIEIEFIPACSSEGCENPCGTVLPEQK